MEFTGSLVPFSRRGRSARGPGGGRRCDGWARRCGGMSVSRRCADSVPAAERGGVPVELSLAADVSPGAGAGGAEAFRWWRETKNPGRRARPAGGGIRRRGRRGYRGDGAARPAGGRAPRKAPGPSGAGPRHDVRRGGPLVGRREVAAARLGTPAVAAGGGDAGVLAAGIRLLPTNPRTPRYPFTENLDEPAPLSRDRLYLAFTDAPHIEVPRRGDGTRFRRGVAAGQHGDVRRRCISSTGTVRSARPGSRRPSSWKRTGRSIIRTSDEFLTPEMTGRTACWPGWGSMG